MIHMQNNQHEFWKAQQIGDCLKLENSVEMTIRSLQSYNWSRTVISDEISAKIDCENINN